MKKSAIYTIFIIMTALRSAAQEAGTDISIGQWQQHLPFNAGLYVTQSDKQVFYATEQALLIIDKEEESKRQVTKVEGLSQVGVNLIKYNRGSEVLLIAYKDGTIDLLSEQGNQTLLGVPISSVVAGEKRINDVFMANDSIAYLAGNFGMVTLNVKRGLFPSTVRTSIDVRSAVAYDESIYLSTEEGIYTIPQNTALNMDDFSNWEWIGGGDGFPDDYTTGAMMPFNGKLYFDLNDSLYVFDGTSAYLLRHEPGFRIEYLSADGPHLLAGFRCNANCKGKVFFFDADHNVQVPNDDCFIFPTYAIEDEQGNIWFGDLAPPFRVEKGGSGPCQFFEENTYVTTLVYDIAVGDGQVWVASGGLTSQGSARFRTEGFSSFIKGEWRRYSTVNVPALNGISDFLDVEIHPQNGKIFAGAFLDALVEYDLKDDSFVVYQENNSTLQTNPNDPDRTRVAGLAFDRDNNLWVCNNGANEPLSVLKADGTWASFGFACTPGKGILKVAVDGFGNKWLLTNDGGQGIIVFNEGDINVAGDNKCRVLNTSNTALPTNDLSSIAVDLDGAVWVGTKQGVIVFQCDPFNPDCKGSLPFVEVDGFGANLLEDQDVTVISVDGANRKWLGTQTGIFVMSPAGNEQVAKFTKENSPLFSNSIAAIAFDNKTGVVWIGTSEGLISYRSDATLGQSFHESNVVVFPNPVRPDYEGPVAIKGLAQDATVKITDVAGQLVYETEANGGQAIWNARDYTGRKVSTGVYLVFATSRNASNPDVALAKILVVN